MGDPSSNPSSPKKRKLDALSSSDVLSSSSSDEYDPTFFDIKKLKKLDAVRYDIEAGLESAKLAFEDGKSLYLNEKYGSALSSFMEAYRTLKRREEGMPLYHIAARKREGIYGHLCLMMGRTYFALSGETGADGKKVEENLKFASTYLKKSKSFFEHFPRGNEELPPVISCIQCVKEKQGMLNTPDPGTPSLKGT